MGFLGFLGISGILRQFFREQSLVSRFEFFPLENLNFLLKILLELMTSLLELIRKTDFRVSLSYQSYIWPIVVFDGNILWKYMI